METILLVSQKSNLFLGVDELMKSAGPNDVKPNNPFSIVHRLGTLLDTSGNVVVLVTTLDKGIVHCDITNFFRTCC